MSASSKSVVSPETTGLFKIVLIVLVRSFEEIIKILVGKTFDKTARPIKPKSLIDISAPINSGILLPCGFSSSGDCLAINTYSSDFLTFMKARGVE